MNPRDFSGTVHTMIAKRQEGFPTFALATLTIKDGRVMKVELGQCLYAFETLARLDAANNNLYEELKRTYPAIEEKK